MSAIDRASNKARYCFDYFHFQAPKTPHEYATDINAIHDLTSECFSALQKRLEAYFGAKDKLEKVRKHSMRVSEFESRIGTLERELTTRMFKLTMDMGKNCISKDVCTRSPQFRTPPKTPPASSSGSTSSRSSRRMRNNEEKPPRARWPEVFFTAWTGPTSLPGQAGVECPPNVGPEVC